MDMPKFPAYSVLVYYGSYNKLTETKRHKQHRYTVRQLGRSNARHRFHWVKIELLLSLCSFLETLGTGRLHSLSFSSF